LRALPASAILDAAQKHGTIGFGPVVDGQFVTEEVQKTYAEAKQAHVPLLAGWNRDERAGTLSKDMTVEKWKAFAKEHYSAHADDFLAAFPAKTDDEAVRAADDYTTDQFIALGTWKWVEAQAKAGVPVYRYRFDLPATQSEMHPEGKYAWHSDELEYVFGTLDVRNGASGVLKTASSAIRSRTIGPTSPAPATPTAKACHHGRATTQRKKSSTSTALSATELTPCARNSNFSRAHLRIETRTACIVRTLKGRGRGAGDSLDRGRCATTLET